MQEGIILKFGEGKNKNTCILITYIFIYLILNNKQPHSHKCQELPIATPSVGMPCNEVFLPSYNPFSAERVKPHLSCGLLRKVNLGAEGDCIDNLETNKVQLRQQST